MTELLLRGTIWLSVLAWTGTECVRLRNPMGSPRSGLARALWTLGALLAVAHVVLALHFRHGWSQAAAWAETARQTRELLGIGVGWGLLVNYLFVVVWAMDAAWWWRPASFAARPRAVDFTIRLFLLFIFVNGTIVFGHGPVRILGASTLIALAVAWYRGRPAGD
jgi:hypothetical protein